MAPEPSSLCLHRCIGGSHPLVKDPGTRRVCGQRMPGRKCGHVRRTACGDTSCADLKEHGVSSLLSRLDDGTVCDAVALLRRGSQQQEYLHPEHHRRDLWQLPGRCVDIRVEDRGQNVGSIRRALSVRRRFVEDDLDCVSRPQLQQYWGCQSVKRVVLPITHRQDPFYLARIHSARCTKSLPIS